MMCNVKNIGLVYWFILIPKSFNNVIGLIPIVTFIPPMVVLSSALEKSPITFSVF